MVLCIALHFGAGCLGLLLVAFVDAVDFFATSYWDVAAFSRIGIIRVARINLCHIRT